MLSFSSSHGYTPHRLLLIHVLISYCWPKWNCPIIVFSGRSWHTTSWMKLGIYFINSERFIDGRHESLPQCGKMQSNKSRPSAREGLLKGVLVVTTGGMKGNFSLSRISKLNFCTRSCTCFSMAAFACSEMAAWSISNYSGVNGGDTYT